MKGPPEGPCGDGMQCLDYISVLVVTLKRRHRKQHSVQQNTAGSLLPPEKNAGWLTVLNLCVCLYIQHLND